MKARTRLALDLAAIFVVVLVLVFTGCARPAARAKSPDTRASAGAVSIVQTGDAQTPAFAESKTNAATITAPEGGTFVLNDKLGTFTATVTGPATVRIETRTDAITAATAYTPPAAPTPKEEAAGKVALWLWIGFVGGLVLAGLGIWWKGPAVIAGGAIVAGSCAFGIWIQDNPWVLNGAGLGALLSLAGFLAWHLFLKKRSIPTSNL